MSLGLPLIAWGSGVASSGLVTSNATVTATQTDLFGGTEAVLVDDTSAASESRVHRVVTVTRAGVQFAYWLLRAGTAVASTCRLYNNTQGTNHLKLDITWSGGVPTVSASTGTSLGAVAVGGGWYVILGLTTSAVAANDQMYWLLNPSGFTPTTPVTNVYLDERKLVLLDYLDSPIADEVPREGSKWVQSYSGVEDAWFIGPDYRLTAKARWVPTIAQATPVIVSGWDGRNEGTAVNCGVSAMLRAGRQKTTLRYVPDRSVCTTYVDSYLVEPMTEAPSLEANNGPFRTFPLVLRNASTPYEGVP